MEDELSLLAFSKPFTMRILVHRLPYPLATSNQIVCAVWIRSFSCFDTIKAALCYVLPACKLFVLYKLFCIKYVNRNEKPARET